MRSTAGVVLLAMVFSACGGANPATPRPPVTADPEDPVVFRAAGQDPKWTLEIDADSIELDWDGDDVTMPATRPIELDDAITYETREDDRSMTILILPRPCTTGGSSFTHSVTIAVDGKQLRGCGRPGD